jgi:hypothetical protein
MERPKLGPDKLGAGSPLTFEGKGGSFAQLAVPWSEAETRQTPACLYMARVTPTYQLFQLARSNRSIQLIDLSLTS